MSKNETNGKAQAPKEQVRLDINPIEFDGVMMETKIVTTGDLMDIVNEFFASVFADYEGCNVTPDPTGAVGVDLFFNTSMVGTESEGLTTAVCDLTNVRKQNVNRYAAYNQRLKARRFDLTDETKEILEGYLSSAVLNNRKCKNWDTVVMEVSESINPNFNAARVISYLKVKFINLDKILASVYGRKEDGHRIAYRSNFAKAMPAINAMGSNINSLYTISRLHEGELNELAVKTGNLLQQPGGIQMKHVSR